MDIVKNIQYCQYCPFFENHIMRLRSLGYLSLFVTINFMNTNFAVK